MKVVICVPNIYLLKQIEKEILRLYPTNNNILKIKILFYINALRSLRYRKPSF